MFSGGMERDQCVNYIGLATNEQINKKINMMAHHFSSAQTNSH